MQNIYILIDRKQSTKKYKALGSLVKWLSVYVNAVQCLSCKTFEDMFYKMKIKTSVHCISLLKLNFFIK